MMHGVLADLEDRKYSIERLLDHINDVGNLRRKIDVIVILKSTVFIAIYNNIEATIFSIIERIHDSASLLSYDELSEPLRKKMLQFSFGKSNSESMKLQQKVEYEEAKLRSTGATFPGISEFIKRQSLFSGNIDARKLCEIGESYGINSLVFSKEHAQRMLLVKNKRNQLAHGEQSMSDGGKGIKTEDLRQAAHSVEIILREFIAAVEKYLKEKCYRKTP